VNGNIKSLVVGKLCVSAHRRSPMVELERSCPLNTEDDFFSLTLEEAVLVRDWLIEWLPKFDPTVTTSAVEGNK